MDTNDSPKVVAEFSYRHEAEMAEGFLRDGGIDAMLEINDAGSTHVGMSTASPARLWVRSDDHARAVQVLLAARIDVSQSSYPAALLPMPWRFSTSHVAR
ncbi:MAG: hypothetical protein ABFS34_06590 [Gemmatimonadota bacterium]